MNLDTVTVILLVVLVFAILLLIRVPVAISLTGASLVGITAVRGFDAGLTALGTAPYSSASNPSLLVIPLFILMGLLAVNAGLADDAFSSAQKILKGLPGGPAISSLAGSGVFASVTGSSVATVATLAKVSTDAIRKAGYPIRLAAGAVTAGGTLGVLIPPSIVLVLYGVIAEESIGTLLVAGVIPGLLSLLMYAITAVLYAKWLGKDQAKSDAPPSRQHIRNKERVSVASSRSSSVAASSHPPRTADLPNVGAGAIAPDSIDAPDKIKWSSLLQLALLFFAAIGTIYLGIATPTEAASFGVFGATLILIFHHRKQPKTFFKNYGGSLTETAGMTAMIFLLLVGAGLFNYFLALTGSTTAITSTFINSPFPGLVVLILALLLLIPLGMFLDGISIVLIATPLLHPVLTSFGYDGIWIAILVVKVAEMALITPPVGLNVFVYKGVVKDIPLSEAFRGVVPFILADVVTVSLLIAFPILVTWLPATAGLL